MGGHDSRSQVALGTRTKFCENGLVSRRSHEGRSATATREERTKSWLTGSSWEDFESFGVQMRREDKGVGLGLTRTECKLMHVNAIDRPIRSMGKQDLTWNVHLAERSLRPDDGSIHGRRSGYRRKRS